MKKITKAILSAVLAISASTAFSLSVFAEENEIIDEANAAPIAQISSEAEPALSIADEPEIEIIEIEDEDSASAPSPFAYAENGMPAMAVANEPAVFEIKDEVVAASDKPVETGDSTMLCETALVFLAVFSTSVVALKLKKV